MVNKTYSSNDLYFNLVEVFHRVIINSAHRSTIINEELRPVKNFKAAIKIFRQNTFYGRYGLIALAYNLTAYLVRFRPCLVLIILIMMLCRFNFFLNSGIGVHAFE